MDADNALGHVAGHYGMNKAIELAKQYGVGSVFMRGSNHYGASGYWARLALRENMIGFAFSNAGANMAPWGAKKQMVGNNPPAWAVPSAVLEAGEKLLPGDTQPAFIDIALSVVAGNHSTSTGGAARICRPAGRWTAMATRRSAPRPARQAAASCRWPSTRVPAWRS